MKKLVIISFILWSFTVCSQDVSGYDIGYKIGVNRLNHAYSTINPDSTFEIHADAFRNSNFYANYTVWNESFMFNGNMEGVLYLAFQKTITKLKSGPLKSVPFGYKKVKKDNQNIAIPNKGDEDSVHPITGLGNYQWVNFDFAWGGKIKAGVNFAWGFLGANGSNNGISLGIAPPINSWNVQTINIGYWQYGLTGHYIVDNENSNMVLSAHLSKMRTITKRFDKRNGFAIELEFKYYFIEEGSTFRPYLTGYMDYRRMKKGVSNVFSPKGINEVNIPALNVNTIGVKVGVLINGN